MDKTVLTDIEEQARKRPDHPAIVEGSGRRISYDELWQDVQKWSHRFEHAGIRSGDLCGFMATDGAQYVTAALGILSAGGCLVPVPESHRDKTNSIYFRNLSLDWVVDEQADYKLREWSGTRDDARPVSSLPGVDPAYVRFTSGTTGHRKGVLLGHETIRERTDAANRALDISPDDRILWLLSMDYHFVVSILTFLKNGATLLIPEHSLAETVLSFMDEHGATVLYATPYHYRLLNGAGESRSLDPLRLAISTSEGMSVKTARQFYEIYQQPVSQALGIIEVGLPAINLDKPLEKPDSVGQVLPDYDVTVVDECGQPVADDVDGSGELHINGPGLFDAYLYPWQPREQVLSAHGFPTGDQGRLDQDGDLFIEGRRTNRINRAGNKFFCEEVERVINTHPDIKVSRVYGKPHRELGEVPYAEIVPEDPENVPGGSELKEYCRDRIASYKIPRSFERASELPRTPTGKIKRSATGGTGER